VRDFVWIPLVWLLVACTDTTGEVIAKIPEASGIAYCAHDDTLIVANDEGAYYNITTKGKVLQKKKLGSYDLEGAVCEVDQILFAIENKGLLIVEPKTGISKKLSLDTMYQGRKLSLFDKKSGVEGVAKAGNALYLAKQSKKKNGSFIAVVGVAPDALHITDIIEHGVADISGLAYHQGYLYLVSDKEDLLIKYDLRTKQSVQEVRLSKGEWEGITFDAKGNVYLADDNGRVVKYKKKKLGM